MEIKGAAAEFLQNDAKPKMTIFRAQTNMFATYSPSDSKFTMYITLALKGRPQI